MRVITGGAETFDALIYHEPHPGTMNYLQQQFDNVTSVLGGMAGSFMDTARRAWDNFGSSQAFQRAKAAVRTITHMWQRDEIKSIWEMGAFQQAPLSMQRFLMANPVVREMYHEQRVDGYSDTYIDMQPDAIGWTHYEYQLVNDGMIKTATRVVGTDKDGKEIIEEVEHVEFFFDDVREGDRLLTFMEQHDLLKSWDAMAALIADGDEDPTSPFAGKIG